MFSAERGGSTRSAYWVESSLSFVPQAFGAVVGCWSVYGLVSGQDGEVRKSSSRPLSKQMDWEMYSLMTRSDDSGIQRKSASFRHRYDFAKEGP